MHHEALDSPTETHLGMWEVLGKEGLKFISMHECPQRSQALRRDSDCLFSIRSATHCCCSLQCPQCNGIRLCS